MHKSYRPERLLSEQRYLELPPKQALSSLGFTTGDICADIGCGSGFFTLPMAEIVGENGHVHACDIDPAMLEVLHRRIEAHSLQNITVERNVPEALPFASERMTRVLAAMVLHGASNPLGLLKECLRILRADGTLFVLEWTYVPPEDGSRQQKRLSVDDMEQLAAAAGAVIQTCEAITDRHTIYRITRGARHE